MATISKRTLTEDEIYFLLCIYRGQEKEIMLYGDFFVVYKLEEELGLITSTNYINMKLTKKGWDYIDKLIQVTVD